MWDSEKFRIHLASDKGDFLSHTFFIVIKETIHMNKKEERFQTDKQERNAVVMCIAVSMLIIVTCANKFFGIL